MKVPKPTITHAQMALEHIVQTYLFLSGANTKYYSGARWKRKAHSLIFCLFAYVSALLQAPLCFIFTPYLVASELKTGTKVIK